MIMAQRQDELFVQDRLEIDIRFLCAEKTDPEIGSPADDAVQDRIGGFIDNADPDMRKPLHETMDDRGQKVVSHRRHAGHRDLPADLCRQIADAQHGLIQLVDGVARPLQKNPADLGETDVACRAFQQLGPQLVFQFFDPSAQGGR